jgi:L-phenylalanine/L-methionine N-acetyltransferase
MKASGNASPSLTDAVTHDVNGSADIAPREAAGIVVRATEGTDLAAIAAISNRRAVYRDLLAMPHLTDDAMKARFEKLPKHTIALCATIEGQVVGFGGLEPEPPRRTHCASIALAVHDDFYRRGVGSALLTALLDCADRSFGLRRVELAVFAENAAAIALYRRFGFVEEGRSRGYAMRDGVLADVLHMARFADAPAFEHD